jgi:hypothetical protein
MNINLGLRACSLLAFVAFSTAVIIDNLQSVLAVSHP